MLRQRARKGETEKRELRAKVRFPGICALATELGVTRTHLYRVLTGERRSPRIESHPKAVRLIRRNVA